MGPPTFRALEVCVGQECPVNKTWMPPNALPEAIKAGIVAMVKAAAGQ